MGGGVAPYLPTQSRSPAVQPRCCRPRALLPACCMPPRGAAAAAAAARRRRTLRGPTARGLRAPSGDHTSSPPPSLHSLTQIFFLFDTPTQTLEDPTRDDVRIWRATWPYHALRPL